MQFVDGVTWRHSQRGLVVCGRGGAPLLVEHERAADLPDLIDGASDATELAALLGSSELDRVLVADLIDEHIIAEHENQPAPQDTPRAVRFSRSGMEITGIDAVARVVHRVVIPVIESWPGRFVIVAVLIGGVVSLLIGRPDGPDVTSHPWVDATFGLILGLGLSALHEIGHAVVLVHYGRTPRGAGVGFYWGALCFYVDSSDGITLPRRARIINALAGLAVDLFTASLLLIFSHVFAATVLVMAVFWRIAILSLVSIVENGLPILEVDGHIAFSDYLDEPDLSPRSREALSRRLRRIKHDDQPRWLAAYGAFSLIGGIILLGLSTWVWWLAAGGLVMALFSGNVAEILLGLYVIVPVAIGLVFSLIGLLLELVARQSKTELTT